MSRWIRKEMYLSRCNRSTRGYDEMNGRRFIVVGYECSRSSSNSHGNNKGLPARTADMTMLATRQSDPIKENPAYSLYAMPSRAIALLKLALPLGVVTIFSLPLVPGFAKLLTTYSYLAYCAVKYTPALPLCLGHHESSSRSCARA